MKTKITSFYLAALVCALTFATGAFADTESGFYEKEHIRGFISIGGDYRGMRSLYEGYVNRTAFAAGGWNAKVAGEDGKPVDQYYVNSGAMDYDSFDDWYIGLHLNIGAQYKQFLTWFDINFMPTQMSEASEAFTTGVAEDGSSKIFPLYDVRWFTYGADWMFGWKIFGENTIINLIPAVGVGFNLINFHLASNYVMTDMSDGSTVTLRDRYYSTMGVTFNSELELRLELGPFGIGIYGGYKVVRYNELEVEGKTLETLNYDTDNVGDTRFIGLRLTWIFLSDWQSKVQNKL